MAKKPLKDHPLLQLQLDYAELERRILANLGVQDEPDRAPPDPLTLEKLRKLKAELDATYHVPGRLAEEREQQELRELEKTRQYAAMYSVQDRPIPMDPREQHGPMSRERAVFLLETASLPPGWSLECRRPFFTLDGSRTLEVHVHMPVTCVRRGTKDVVTLAERVPLLAHTEASLAAWLLSTVKRLLEHEAEEWVKLGGRYVADPHGEREGAWCRQK